MSKKNIVRENHTLQNLFVLFFFSNFSLNLEEIKMLPSNLHGDLTVKVGSRVVTMLE